VYYGDDGYWGSDMAVAPFITCDLVKAVGYLQMPKLMHLCNDTIWTLLGDMSNCLYYLPKILIEHIHPEIKGIERDVITQRVNSPEMYSKDYMNFFMWKKDCMAGDLEKCCSVVLRTKQQ